MWVKKDILYKINKLRRNNWSGNNMKKSEGIISDSLISWGNRWIGDSASRDMLRKMIQIKLQTSVQTDILKDKYQLTCCWIVEIRYVVVEKIWEIDEVSLLCTSTSFHDVGMLFLEATWTDSLLFWFVYVSSISRV